MRTIRRSLTAVFQDPSGSLNRRHTAGRIVAAPLVAHDIGSARARRDRVVELLELVGLGSEFLRRRPAEMSGGQCQRVAIARALATEPSLVVLDEAVSSLDVSIQAQVLNLLRQLQRENDLAFLFISHDLAVVRFLCTRVAVMYRGRIVETGPREVLFGRPLHPYTHTLMRAIPVVDPVRARELISVTPVREVIDMPTAEVGCRFRALCPIGRDQEICRTVDPELRSIEVDHAAACHFPQAALDPSQPTG
jgi:oligopeptide/dipeptide ABC transporter ATP-binding protein